MPDYVDMFCSMVDRGHDMADLDWSVWQELAAEMLFSYDPEELDGVTLQ